MSDKIGTILRINEESIQTKLLSKDPRKAPEFLPDIKRHSLFQQIHREISPANPPAFGQTFTFEIPYFGDLLGECALAITLPSPETWNATAISEAGGVATFLGPRWGYRNNLGYNLIQNVGLFLNGVLLDRQQGEVMCLNQGLTEKEDGRDRGLLNLVGRKTAGTVTAGTDLTNSPISLLVPLQFWFCRSPRQALPIVSLNDETLELRVTLSPLANILFFNHVAPITVDAVATPISFIGGQQQKRDGGGALSVDGFESGGAVTSSLLSATGPATPTDFQPTRASLWVKQQFLGQEEQALYGRRILDYPLLQVARIPDTMTEGTKIVRIPINTKNPIARIFVALEDVRVTQPLEAGGNLSEAFLYTRLGSSGGVPTGQDLTGSGSAKLLGDGQYPIEKVTLLQESYRRHEMDVRRLCFTEADDRGGFLWQVPGAGLIAWDEYIKNEGPTGEATMVNLQPELEIRLTDTAAAQNYRIVCFLMTYNVFRIQNGGGALLFEQNG